MTSCLLPWTKKTFAMGNPVFSKRIISRSDRQTNKGITISYQHHSVDLAQNILRSSLLFLVRVV